MHLLGLVSLSFAHSDLSGMARYCAVDLSAFNTLTSLYLQRLGSKKKNLKEYVSEPNFVMKPVMQVTRFTRDQNLFHSSVVRHVVC